MSKKVNHDVPVQKGKIISNPPTMKQMTYSERVKERAQEITGVRRGQHTDLHTPKQGKK